MISFSWASVLLEYWKISDYVSFPITPSGGPIPWTILVLSINQLHLATPRNLYQSKSSRKNTHSNWMFHKKSLFSHDTVRKWCKWHLVQERPPMSNNIEVGFALCNIWFLSKFFVNSEITKIRYLCGTLEWLAFEAVRFRWRCQISMGRFLNVKNRNHFSDFRLILIKIAWNLSFLPNVQYFLNKKTVFFSSIYLSFLDF